MDPVLLTTFGTLIVLLIFTVPIGVSIGTAVFMGMMVGGLPPVFLAQKMYSALDSFPLLAVPFFIVAGDIMQKGTIANSLLAVSRCLVGHIKGGMAHISILTSLFYGALSGSAAATVAAVGGIMIPAMEKEGYPKEFATAVNSTSGCLGIMIPGNAHPFRLPPAFPSATSSGASFRHPLGCAVLVVRHLCAGSTENRGPYQIPGNDDPVRSQWAIMVPSSSSVASTAASPPPPKPRHRVITLFVECSSRSMTRKLFFEIIELVRIARHLPRGGLRQHSAIMMTNLSAAVLDTIMGISTSKVVIMALILVVLLILGTFLEAAAIIMIVTPLLLPVINAIGVDPVHFGIIMLTSFAVGGQTPPVGMTLFVGASIAKISIERLSIASIPYILTLVVMLVIIAFVPQLSLCLI
ncbi:MAG: TRAP transporter large permease subunit [Bilophila wadsworthia]